MSGGVWRKGPHHHRRRALRRGSDLRSMDWVQSPCLRQCGFDRRRFLVVSLFIASGRLWCSRRGLWPPKSRRAPCDALSSGTRLQSGPYRAREAGSVTQSRWRSGSAVAIQVKDRQVFVYQIIAPKYRRPNKDRRILLPCHCLWEQPSGVKLDVKTRANYADSVRMQMRIVRVVRQILKSSRHRAG